MGLQLFHLFRKVEKMRVLLVAICFLFLCGCILARPQQTWCFAGRCIPVTALPSILESTNPNYLETSKLVPVTNLGGSWSVGNIPAGGASGINYETGPWQFGAGVKPNLSYGGVGVSFDLESLF